MDEILHHIVLFGVHAAAVCALFAILFIDAPRRLPLRVITIVLGLVAMVLPVFAIYGTLGYPDPWPAPGNYDVLGWKFDEARRAIYAFVRQEGEERPRLYKVDFDLSTALGLQEAREHPEYLDRIGLVVTAREEGPPEIGFEFVKRNVIFSPAEQEERERLEREDREARERQIEQERRADELESLERMKREISQGGAGGKSAAGGPVAAQDKDEAGKEEPTEEEDEKK